MNYEFKLPDIGEGLTEGEIVKWHVKEGDSVAENQSLCNVLTDKAEVEIPSPKSGKIVKLFAKPGEKVKVHAPLVTLEVGAAGGKGEKAPEPKAAPAKAASKAEKAAPAPKEAVRADGSPAAKGGPYEFKLPDIGEGLTEGEIVKWHVKVGDQVFENQPLCNVLTDKAEVEIPSPKSGKIAKLYAKAGEKVKVHAPLVALEGVSGHTSAVQPHKADGRPSDAASGSDIRSHRPSPPPSGRASAAEVRATPMVRQLAKQMGIDLSLVPGTGPDGRILEADVRNFRGGTTGPAGAAPARPGAPVNATAAVKQLASELGVDLSRVSGTGPGGRIAEWDVRNLAPAKTSAPSATSRMRPQGPDMPLSFTPASAPSQGEERAPFVGIRRKIAEKMSQSVRTVAHVTHMDECDMTEIVALREKLKGEAAQRGVKLTFLPFIIRALLKTLKEYPQFNSSLDEAKGELVTKHYYNVGIAVSAGQGLVVPNIKGADGKDLWGLAADVHALAEKVRAGKIDVSSLQGGTFTITNIGPIGGLFATPIVNHPEVAILGLLKLQKRPVYRDGGIFVRDMMNLVLSFDHRVIDGADAAHFMNTLIKHLENPRTIL